MNQIVSMFKKSNERMDSIMKGNANLTELSSAQREFEGQIKLVNAVVNAFAIQSKNKRAMAGLEKMNILDANTAVDMMLGDPELDKVKCPANDKIITRAECLDFSGDRKFEECEGCDVGVDNKRRLLS